MTDWVARGHSPRMESAVRRAGPASEGASARGAQLPFDEAYEATFDLAWRTLRRLGVPPAQLDDAAQEVFVIVHRRLKDFEGRSSLKTWVAGIAVRVASDVRRSFRRQGERAPLDEQLVDPGPSPVDAASCSQARALVEKLLRQLDEGQREVFVLVELEGLSVPEVAEALELKLNTAYSRLRLARKDFTAALAAWRAAEGGG